MADRAGAVSTMLATGPFGFRYQYLAGGVNTGDGWTTWAPDGRYVTDYIAESSGARITPVLTYYMLSQSAPARADGKTAVLVNLQDPATMAAYWTDLRLFFQRAGASSSPVILHVEPDLWGFTQQLSKTDDATTVPAHVGSSGVPELAGLSDTMAGFAQAVLRLRDTYAPHVIVAYHLSIWGTGYDITYADPAPRVVDALASRAAAYYRSLGAAFDISFSEFSDRDAAFKQFQYGDGGASWWDAADFDRNVRFLSGFVRQSGTRVVIWQVPFGNTKMRAVDNTWNHYQDNRVEWLLDDPDRTHLQQYANAGVVAFLFGRGADGATCACDASRDGVTDPPAVNGNDRPSLSADDDGGFFRDRAANYYAVGPLQLPLARPADAPFQSHAAELSRAD